eukprot:UN31518
MNWRYETDKYRPHLEKVMDWTLIDTGRTKGDEAKVLRVTFEEDESMNYILRLPITHMIRKCHKDDLRFHKIPPNYWFLDLIAYHVDRLLDFRMVPHTTSFRYPLNLLVHGITLDDPKHDNLKTEDIERIIRTCEMAQQFILSDETTFGTIQTCLPFMKREKDKIELATFDFVDRDAYLDCIPNFNCSISPP